MRIKSRVYKIIALMLLTTTMLTGCGNVLNIKDTTFVEGIMSNQRTAYSVCMILDSPVENVRLNEAKTTVTATFENGAVYTYEYHVNNSKQDIFVTLKIDQGKLDETTVRDYMKLFLTGDVLANACLDYSDDNLPNVYTWELGTVIVDDKKDDGKETLTIEIHAD